MSTDVKPLLDAAEAQGWTLAPTAKGRTKCIPPNPDASIVFVSETREPRTWQNTLRDLRSSGLRWPWPPPVERGDLEKQLYERAAAAQQTTKIEGVAGGGTSFEPAPVESPEAKLERLFSELKDARALVRLAEEELDELAGKVAAATAEREAAVERLQAVKTAFDQALGIKGAAAGASHARSA